VRLDYRMLNSNAFRSLSPNARALLIELIMLYNGENNGSLYLSVRDAAHRMGLADLTAVSRAFAELLDLGFIEMTEVSSFHVKAAEKSRARCWRLTWEAGPARRAPSWEFMEREPAPQTHAQKRMERGLRSLKVYRKARDLGRLPVLDSDTMNSFQPEVTAPAVLDSNTLDARNRGFPPNRCDRDSATHIATTIGSAAEGYLLGWWQRGRTPRAASLAIASSRAPSANAAHRRAAA
jgi:hypothetical protein